MPIDERPIVYSTAEDFEPVCSKCKSSPCRCQAKPSLPPDKQLISIRREKKGRRGKTVTTMGGFQLNKDDLKFLLKTLKSYCGSGGTVKDGVIEIQGDHREKLATRLQQFGYHTKFSGG